MITPDINRGRVMQLATMSTDGPWLCSVYFVFFEGCFYWLSLPDRRHSRELAYDTRAAIAVVLEGAQPVVGIQSEGTAQQVLDISVIEPVMSMYVEKYGEGADFVDRFRSGVNKHAMYCFSPIKVRMFDEMRGLHQDIAVDGVWL